MDIRATHPDHANPPSEMRVILAFLSFHVEKPGKTTVREMAVTRLHSSSSPKGYLMQKPVVKSLVMQEEANRYLVLQ